MLQRRRNGDFDGQTMNVNSLKEDRIGGINIEQIPSVSKCRPLIYQVHQPLITPDAVVSQNNKIHGNVARVFNTVWQAG